MRVRSVLQEYEAQLKPIQSASVSVDSAHGKGEWKVYGNSTRQCNVWVTGLNLSDGAVPCRERSPVCRVAGARRSSPPPARERTRRSRALDRTEANVAGFLRRANNSGR